MDFKEILTASMILFAIIDIIGATPIVISLRKKVGKIESEKATLVSMIIMIGFLFLGEEILNLIGIDINSFAVAGSIVIFFIALEMVLGVTIFQGDEPETASIVPIAFPIIAGAGTLTTLLSLRAEYELINVIIAIIINSVLLCIAFLMFSKAMPKFSSCSMISPNIITSTSIFISVKLFISKK